MIFGCGRESDSGLIDCLYGYELDYRLPGGQTYRLLTALGLGEGAGEGHDGDVEPMGDDACGDAADESAQKSLRD